jgi:hypothetical protein
MMDTGDVDTVDNMKCVYKRFSSHSTIDEMEQDEDDTFGDLEGDLVISKNITSSQKQFRKFRRHHKVSLPMKELVLVRLSDLSDLGISLNDMASKGMVFNGITNSWEMAEGYSSLDIDMTGFEPSPSVSTVSNQGDNVPLQTDKILISFVVLVDLLVQGRLTKDPVDLYFIKRYETVVLGIPSLFEMSVLLFPSLYNCNILLFNKLYVSFLIQF